MIYEKIVKYNDELAIEKNKRIIVTGVNEYRNRIMNSCFPKGIPGPEIPFFLAALNLTANDMRTFAKRENNLEKYMDVADSTEILVERYTFSVATSREVENG